MAATTITLDWMNAAGRAADLRIARVTVTETLSDLYRMEVIGLLAETDSDLRGTVGVGANLLLELSSGQRRQFSGVLAEAQMLGADDRAGGYWYRLVFMPHLHFRGLIRRSRSLLNTTATAFDTSPVPAPTFQVWDVLTAILVNPPATVLGSARELPPSVSLRRVFSQDASFPLLAAALQVDETDLDFLRRTAEQAGLGWWFAIEDSTCVCFSSENTDYPNVPDPMSYPPAVGGPTLTFALDPGPTPGDGSGATDAPTLHAVGYRKRVVSQAGHAASWDPEKPATPLVATYAGTGAGAADSFPYMGVQAQYECGYTTAAVGNRQAMVRAQEAGAMQETLSGTGSILGFSAGYVFMLGSAEPSWLEQKYLLTAVTHEAWQSFSGSEAFLPTERQGRESGYLNRFEAIPFSVAYRPPRRTPVPVMAGMWRATIQGGGRSGPQQNDTSQPYLDPNGHYHVLLPFPDNNGDPAALWAPLRLTTAFGGTTEGLHQPLRPGTNVLLAFEHGNPDRPFIVGLLPDEGQKSPVTSNNPRQGILRSFSGIVVKFTDPKPTGSA
ncbi:contractile injection system protein, VgrG/Pvc8 family [Roseomonas sp. NAR14]|uniref:Contractile injection system protein, VgrG/Pvc8 family n=1 Tax=Roseomonas acroporae TaxID=2937791 RepID=A0A9X1Y5J0_9PROT|nr:contractile injection system protein, VgrG/Pvc8 family [Roseomonas acroporae]MCK8784359.1 contractile injection system protein, VgrG/Pvc8 family [Roseomonas acroporae]